MDRRAGAADAVGELAEALAQRRRQLPGSSVASESTLLVAPCPVERQGVGLVPTEQGSDRIHVAVVGAESLAAVDHLSRQVSKLAGIVDREQVRPEPAVAGPRWSV